MAYSRDLIKVGNNGRTIPEAVITELKEIPIHSVCDSLGINYKGDCPSGHDSQGHNCFHTFPHTNTWNCFHCKDSGEKLRIDTIGLVETTNKVNFPEACNYLIDQFKPDLRDKFSGISAEELQKITEKRQKTEQVYKALNYAMDYYNKKLWENKEAIDYLKGRNITEEFIRDNPYVKFGYAPLKQEDLKQELFSKFGEEVTLATGLYSKSDKGFIYPTMKIWIEELNKEIPVITYSYQMGGQARYIIGRRFTPVMEGEIREHRFSKLKLKEDGIIKNEIFGIDSLSIKNSNLKNSVLISEGLFDAILAIQNNIPCISPVTVTFSDKQLPEMCKTVRKFETVYIVPDPDLPGEKGAVETAKQLIKEGKSVKVVTLPRIDGVEKFDLADYFKQYTVEDFFHLCSQGISLIDFLIQSIPQETEKTGLKKLFENKDIIKTIHAMDAITQEHYRGVLSERFKLEMSTVKDLFIDIQTPVKVGPLPPTPAQEPKKYITDDIRLFSYSDIMETIGDMEDNAIVSYLFYREGISMIFGEPGSGKTWLAKDVGVNIAEGRKVWGRYNCKPQKVLFLEGDFSFLLLKDRLKHFNLTEIGEKNFRSLTADEFEKKGYEYKIDTEEGKKNIEAFVDLFRPDFLIIDSLCSFMEGDESKSEAVKSVITYLRTLSQKYKLHVMIIHHSRKRTSLERHDRKLDQSDMIGSSILQRKVDSLFAVNTLYEDGEKIDNKGMVIEVKQWMKYKVRFEYSLVENELDRTEIKYNYDNIESAKPKKQKAKEAIFNTLYYDPNDARTKEQLINTTGMGKRTIEEALKQLIKEEKIEATGKTQDRKYKIKLKNNSNIEENDSIEKNNSNIKIDNSTVYIKSCEKEEKSNIYQYNYSNIKHGRNMGEINKEKTILTSFSHSECENKNYTSQGEDDYSNIDTLYSNIKESEIQLSTEEQIKDVTNGVNTVLPVAKSEKQEKIQTNGVNTVLPVFCKKMIQINNEKLATELLDIKKSPHMEQINNDCIKDYKRRYNEALRDYEAKINIEQCKDVMRETIGNLKAMGINATDGEIQRGFELCRI